MSLRDVTPPEDGWNAAVPCVMTNFMTPFAKMIMHGSIGDYYTVSVVNQNDDTLKYYLESNKHAHAEIVPVLQPVKPAQKKNKSKKNSRNRRVHDLAHKKANHEISSSLQLVPISLLKPRKIAEKDEDPYQIGIKVVHVVSPDEIYVNIVQRTELFDQIHNKMQKFYNNQRGIAPPDLKEGSLCAIQMSRNNAYYRGKIESVQSDKEITVFLIDTGKKVLIPKEKIQSLAPIFHEMPAYLFKIRLGGILPCGGSSTWPSSSSQRLEEIITEHINNKFFIAKIGDDVNDAMTVDLYLEQFIIEGPLAPTKVQRTLINRDLVDEGLALPIKHFSDMKLKVLAADVKREINCHNNDFELKEDIAVEDEVFDDSDDNSDDLSSDIEELDPPQPCLKRLPVRKPTWRPAESFSKDKFIAKITYVDWDGFIYVISHDQNFDMLRKMESKLNSHYRVIKYSENEWAPGDMCIAKFHQTENWCRAMVHEVRPRRIALEFVDYGNMEWEKPTSLRKELMLKDTPRQCTKCKIHNLCSSAPNRKWSKNDLEALHCLLVEKKCEVVVLRRRLEYVEVALTWVEGIQGSLHDHVINNLRLQAKMDEVMDDCEGGSAPSADLYVDNDNNVTLLPEKEDSDKDDSSDVEPEDTNKLDADVFVYQQLPQDDVEPLISAVESMPDQSATPDTLESNSPGVFIEEIIECNSPDVYIEEIIECSSSDVYIEEIIECPEPLDNHNQRNESEADCESSVTSDNFDEECFEGDDELADEYSQCEELQSELLLPPAELSGKYWPLVMPKHAKIFYSLIGEVDENQANIVWLHVASTRTKSKLIKHRRIEHETLTKAMQKKAEQQPLLQHFEVGVPCCVKFSRDQLWYRAVISSDLSNGGMVEVKYVDWGNTELVELDDIRCMPLEWLNPPTMAIKCRLWNTRVRDNQMAREWLKNISCNSSKVFVTTLLGQEDDCLVVKLFPSVECNVLVYQELLDNKCFVANVKDYYLS